VKAVLTSVVSIVLALLVGFAAAMVDARINERTMQEKLDNLASDVAAQVKDRMARYEYGLRGARGLIIGTGLEGLSYDTFVAYAQSRDLDREFPGSRGFGFIARVAETDVDSFVEARRSSGQGDFSVSYLHPHDGERFIIQYIEPVARNRQAVGLDIASEKSRRDAALASLASGSMALTKPITLVQASGRPMSGFLLLLPVIKDRMSPDSIEERFRDTVGWTYTPIVIDEVLSTLSRARSGFELKLYDVSDIHPLGGQFRADLESRFREGILFYSSLGPEEPDSWRPTSYLGRHKKTVFVSLFSRTWALEVAPTQRFIEDVNFTPPALVGSIVAVLTALSSLLLLLLLQDAKKKQQYRLTRELLADLVDNSSDAILSHTKEGTISSWNLSAQRMFGYTSEEAIGHHFCGLLISDEEVAGEERRLNQVVRGESLSSYLLHCRTKDGSILEASVTTSPILDSQGSIIGVTRTIRDVGQEKSFEAKLIALNNSLEAQVRDRTRDLDERNLELEISIKSFEQVIEFAPYALLMVNDRGEIELFNSMAEAIFGYSSDEIIGSSVHRLLPEALRERHVSMHAAYLENPEKRLMGHGRDLQAVRKDGSAFPSEIGLAPVASTKGAKVLVAIIDLTLRKQHEAMIAKYSSLQKAILASAGFAIVASDQKGLITLFNPAAERLFGYRAEEVIGSATPAFFKLPKEIQSRASHLAGAQIQRSSELVDDGSGQRSGVEDFEWTYVRRDGCSIPILLRISVMLDKANESIGYLGIAVDLTEQKETAKKLELYSQHLSEMVAERTRELEVAQQELLSQERLKRDLQLAAEIQDNLVTRRVPLTDCYDIAVFARPARMVSGDIYDVIVMDSNKVEVFLADISGKGIPAALLTTVARTLFKQGVRRGRSCSEIHKELESMLSEDLQRAELFMTCQICDFDYRTGTLSYRNAGHTETIVYRYGSEDLEYFEPTDLPVGTGLASLIDAPAQRSIFIAPGDLLIFYSDGLTETHNVEGQQFGLEPLKDLVLSHQELSAQDLLQSILDRHRAFSGDRDAEDDVSVIVVKVRESVIEHEWHAPPIEMDAVVQALVSPCRGYGPDFASEMELMISELVSNIVRHAYRFSLPGGVAGASFMLSSRMTLSREGVTLETFDRGVRFPSTLESIPEHKEDLLSEGGFGLSIVKQLSREFSYERLEDGSNHWIIVKDRGH